MPENFENEFSLSYLDEHKYGVPEFSVYYLQALLILIHGSRPTPVFIKTPIDGLVFLCIMFYRL